jgi:nucleotide-binding universal stress UspA family protein
MKHGMSLVDAVVDAGAVRFRPMLLTAAAVIVGSAVMLFDPIFQGLAISLMAGEVASLLLSRMAVPVLFYLSERKKHGEKTVRSDEKTVLCPTDLGPQSAIAVKYAAAIAERSGANLKLMLANEHDVPPYFTSSQIDEISAELDRSDEAEAESLRQFMNEHLGHGADATLLVIDASARTAILEESEKTDTVLIALGTHGRSGFEKLRVGSVAEAVLRESQCPVLTVGPMVEPVSSVQIRRIVCPVDLSPESEVSLRYAAQMAGLFGAELFVIRVADENSESDDESKLKALCDWVPSEIRGQCKLQEIVRHGDLSTEVVRLSNDLSADIIVIGVTHGTFGDETLGDMTTGILREAACPVITVVGIGS